MVTIKDWTKSLTVIAWCLSLLLNWTFGALAWDYRYDGTWGIWADNGVDRFRYDYGAQQWWDYASFGNWQKLGTSGASPVTVAQGANPSNFLGDGTWHNIGNGWRYSYLTSNAVSIWADNTAPLRFSYCYLTGQWNDFYFPTRTWSGLGLAGRSSAFVGDGSWHDLGNGWWYEYVTGSVGVSLWRDNTDPFRFSYCYNTGQWNDFSFHTPGYWSGIGAGNMSSAFIGDTYWHDVLNGWWYSYTAVSNMGVSLWHDNTSPIRFSYCYNTGQWNDFYFPTRTWSGLGWQGQSSAFIGDGAYHALWGTGDTAKYKYQGGYGYWASSGVVNDNDFGFNYAAGQWYRYYDGSTAFENVSYLGSRRYVLTDYIYWTSAGLKSSTYTGSSYGTDVEYFVWNDSSNSQLAYWYIFTPGSDLKWSGGSLQVVVVDSSDQGGGYGPWMLMCEQYTKDDVVVLEYPFENGATLSQILQGLGYVTTYYGKTIDDLAVMGHGNTTGFYFGNWISTSNYSSTYLTSWTTLNQLMTDGGHFMLYHCETGSATSMLNNIASWTNTRVFANVNLQWDSWMGRVNYSYAYGAANVWNANYIGWFMGRSARVSGEDYYALIPNFNFIDLDFEYQSYTALGKRGYHMLFNPNSPAGWPQADMVYWWNNGNGRP